jgi:hypothetical protein
MVAKKARPYKMHGLILQSPDSALGSLPSVALSSGQAQTI